MNPEAPHLRWNHLRSAKTGERRARHVVGVARAVGLPMNPVAADVRRLRLKFLKQSWSLLTSAATVQGFNARIAWGILSLLVAPIWLAAQTPPQLPPGGLMQLQVPQAAVDVSSPVTATAQFDPPVVRAGETTYYRVSLDATESSVAWPDELSAPVALRFGPKRSGQITQVQPGKFRPLASFVYEVTAPVTGHFTVTNFSVDVTGVRVQIPDASLDVVAADAPAPAARRLGLEVSTTNLFLGQPFHARVILPANAVNQIEALREIEFSGDGLMTDKTALQQLIEPVNLRGELKNAFVAEMKVTPIAAGRLRFSAQGFAAGRDFVAPLSIRGQVSFANGLSQYVLLVSEPAEILVRPLPVEGELPGFTGSIGKFRLDPPRLSAGRLHVGEPLQLHLAFHPEGDLTRFVPPAAPRDRDWQIIADPPPATSFTLIPLTDETQATPAIPFSYFDPDAAKYVDLTIAPVPVVVVGDGLPAEVSAPAEDADAAAPSKLSALATTPGQAVWSLKPLQLRGWFEVLELAPVLGFFALWQWDRRRRYLEAHPEIVRRAQARRALRREKRDLQQAADAGDARAFVHHAARAMSIAVAPHFPAHPRAVVGGDVLAQLPDAAPDGLAAATVKQVFAAAAERYAVAPATPPEVPALRPGVEAVLQMLEEKL